MKRTLVTAIALAIVAIAAWQYISPRPDTSVPARLNVVLVTIDTLRADRLGRGLTPALDRLAASGLSFANARATAPLTLPSHAALMTGRLPAATGVRDNGVPLKSGTPTLATLLRARGYATGGFVGAYVLDRRFGLAEGFETYNDQIPRNPDSLARLEADRRAEVVVDAALSWLSGAGRPFLLWVHLYDPHAPYEPPQAYRTAGRSLYDGEVAYADAQVGRLLEALRAQGLLSNTLTIVASDHGEGLGDHGEELHGLLAYDSTLRVPLIVAGPGIRGGVESAPVSLSEVAPAALRRADSGAPPWPGAPRPDIFDQLSADRDVYAETEYPRHAGWHPLAVLAGAQWKLVLSSEAELYDVAADPGETRNLATERASLVQAMTTRLRSMQGDDAASESGPVPADVAARLRALGYVSGVANVAVDPKAPNPAREIQGWNRFERALGVVKGGRPDQALGELQALSVAYPDAPVMQTTYARALLETGNPRGAVAVYRAAVARWPRDPSLFHDLAVAAEAAGDLTEAMRAERAALAIDGGHPAAHNGIGLLLAQSGRPSEAIASFERAAQADPTNPSYWANLGNARQETRDIAGAEAAYRRALEADPDYPDAANGLGVLLIQGGRAADAVPWFERAVRRAPDFHQARLNLGIAYQQSGQREKAADAYRTLAGSTAPAAARERRAAAELLRKLK